MPKNTPSEMLDYTFGLVCLIFLILGFVTTRRRSRYSLPRSAWVAHRWECVSDPQNAFMDNVLASSRAVCCIKLGRRRFLSSYSGLLVIPQISARIFAGEYMFKRHPPSILGDENIPPIGVQYKKIAKKVQERLHQAYDVPHSQIKEQMEFGTASPSAIVSWIEEHPNATPEEINMAKLAIGVFYTALESLFMILAMYPDVQRKAQAEIDTLIGSDRLPNFNDRHRGGLPQIAALDQLKIPGLAIPHSVMKDDVYMGYYIPAGATVIANSWAVLHDPYLYPDPFEVKPERDFQSGEGINPDPRAFAFGYGRRVCPGQPLAEDSLYIVAATVLATMNVGPDGLVLEPVVEYTGDLIRLALALIHPDTQD
ncbi:predicted protein [Postia placenta Mad-698-R]|uniref:Cytochrome P450 n=1 Tax=Postia placenta MAD-698-R-SB12 TaxID=670580 RepID=A0A1X6MKZ3_9APHY|nr:hypothetical protein POSPLADRAFT_1157904 [Postia placenta MAD-698-R-SB12]EED79025.1 predicted protein [Postia placenta Mad-698-R]OSX56978.1 hypothetical protein POSPLADRAFT_1157904 [Postia placenta MAD-698-R-SB12]